MNVINNVHTHQISIRNELKQKLLQSRLRNGRRFLDGGGKHVYLRLCPEECQSKTGQCVELTY